MLAFGRCHVIRFMAILFFGLFLLAVCNKKSTNGDNVIIDPPEPPVNTPALDWSASWNATNNKIAYIHYENDTTNTVYPTGIYVMDPDGGNRIRIFLSRRIIHLDWSPDGSKIACVLRGGPTSGIYTLNHDGSEYRLIIPWGDFPVWFSPDSILYLNLDYDLPIGSIYISDARGQNRRLVVDGSSCGITRFEKINAHFGEERIAASAVIPGASFYLYTYDMQQNDLRRFLEYADFADFSPDGDSIIYTYIKVGYGNLNVICWDGTGARQLTF